VFRITADKICDGPDNSRVGLVVGQMPLYTMERILGEDDSLTAEGDEVKFRLLDDDGEVYYIGVLTDDDECNNQIAALRWGEADAGCTTIEVRRNGEWVLEIS